VKQNKLTPNNMNTNNGKPHVCGEIAVHKTKKDDTAYLCPKCNMAVDQPMNTKSGGSNKRNT